MHEWEAKGGDVRGQAWGWQRTADAVGATAGEPCGAAATGAAANAATGAAADEVVGMPHARARLSFGTIGAAALTPSRNSKAQARARSRPAATSAICCGCAAASASLHRLVCASI